MTDAGLQLVYCHFTNLSDCGPGPWTMVMKLDGNKVARWSPFLAQVLFLQKATLFFHFQFDRFSIMSIHFQVCFNRPKNEFFFDIIIQIIIIIVIIIII